MATSKKESLRQQMRVAAENKLHKLIGEMSAAAGKVIEDTTIDPQDLMGMLCKTQTSTLKEKLITRLANEAESDLVALWAQQNELDLGEKSDD